MTPDEITAIAAMLEDGKTATQIGVALGRTRNSVVGAVHRTPALRRIGFSNPPPRMYWLQKKRRMIQKARPKAKAVSRETPMSELEPPPLEGVAIIDLRDHHCRFPLWGDDLKLPVAGKRCCGKRTARGYWCAEHAVKVFGRAA